MKRYFNLLQIDYFVLIYRINLNWYPIEYSDCYVISMLRFSSRLQLKEIWCLCEACVSLGDDPDWKRTCRNSAVCFPHHWWTVQQVPLLQRTTSSRFSKLLRMYNRYQQLSFESRQYSQVFYQYIEYNLSFSIV